MSNLVEGSFLHISFPSKFYAFPHHLQQGGQLKSDGSDEGEIAERMRILLISVLCAFTIACIYRDERYKDGDTWVMRSTFIMKCTLYRNGSWNARVISCRTNGGVIVEPGQSLVEGDTYECMTMPDGHIEIKRTYYNSRVQQSCEGHGIGESWISQRSFRKICTPRGALIVECLTDAGFVVPLNRHLVFSGIVYKCTQYSNGTVSIGRETNPLPTNFKSHLKPVEVLGPMWKKFQQSGRFVQSEEDSGNEPRLIGGAVIHSEQAPPPKQSRMAIVTCNSEGVVRHPEETWIYNNKFTKKCLPNGAVVILNCLIDGRTAIDVNAELKLGDRTYRCYRNETERSVYLDVSRK